MTLVGTVKGTVGGTTATSVAVVLPASIPAGSILVLGSAANLGTATASISGVSGTVTVLSGPDRRGTVESAYLWSVPVGAADSGATVTVTWSATGRIVAAGAVLSAQQTPSAGTPLIVAASSGTMPTVTNQSGDTLEIALAETTAAAAPVVTLPSPYTVDDSTGTTFASSGVNLHAAVGVDTGTGGGSVTTSPAAASLIGYSVSLAPSAFTRTGTATLALAASAVGRPAVTGTATLALTATGTSVQVAIRTGTATLALTPTGVGRPAVRGTATLGLSATGVGVPASISEGRVTVTIGGTWTQTWDLDRDLSPADLTLINAAGCVLDGLNAAWQAKSFFDQPEPVTLSMSLYIPETAAGPEPAEGVPVAVSIEPRGYVPGTGYDLLLEFYGRITDSPAKPWADGLWYDLIAVDHLSELGEVRTGRRKWSAEYAYLRVARIAKNLRSQGLKLEHPWPETDADVPNSVTLGIAAWAAASAKYLPLAWSDGTYYAPQWPDRAAEGIPVNEMLGEVTLTRPTWCDPYPATVKDYRHAGNFDLAELYAKPTATDWRRTYMQSYVLAGVDSAGDTVYRVQWATHRVENQAGLPMRAGVHSGVFGLTYRADAGEIPDTSRDGAWIPACAVPKDTIAWAVDKTDYPNRVTLEGFWVDWRDPQDSVWYWWQDRTWEQPERVKSSGPTEEVLATGFLTQPGMTEDLAATVVPLNEGDWIARARLGFWSDTLPRHVIESFEVLCDQIPDGRQWPRLFPDPHRATTDVFGGYMGRFLFVYGIRTAWNPRGQAHYFGQLIGATLAVERGKVKLSATVTQRRPGPNGPVGTLPTAVDGDFTTGEANLATRLRGQDPTPAIKWTDLSSTYPTVTWGMIDPTITALDLWMALPS